MNSKIKMSKLKIALLCNSRVAIPVAQRMMQEGVLSGIATADKDPETVAIFKTLAAQLKTGYRKITRNGCADQLLSWINETGSDSVFVVNFPWRIPAHVLELPRHGFLNFHYGLLPEMRGADPVFETIRQSMPTAGATVHVMDTGLDTGPIVLRREVPMQPGLTYGMLSSQMAALGESMCAEILQQAQDAETISGSWCGIQVVAQNEAKAKYWPKVGEAEMTINWQLMNSSEIMALVWACNPIAKGVPTSINGWKIGVVDVTEVNLQGDASQIVPGTIVVADPQNGLIVFCKDGKGLKLETVYTAEGVFPGYKLGFFGIAPGQVFA